MLSGSGESVGQFWSAAPNSKADAFDNLWFRTSLQQRLHLCNPSSGQFCQLRKAERGDERCLEPLTVEHVHNCQSGVSRFRPHRSLIIKLADVLRDMKAYVDVERYCVDLLQQNEDGTTREA
eukprot:4664184-Karenia_brevis.AAC.1